MASKSSVRNCILAALLSGTLIGCGAKRSNKFSGACSSLKAVADLGQGAPKTLRAGETHDPSAVMLLFRAQSDKISIESRCNARLVHTLTVKNAASPVDFNAVEFQLSAPNDNTLELHTSAHCFFRVWDARVDSQLRNNPELSASEVKKILSSDLERYHLYKALLTSSQKLIAVSASGEPIEFEYKLKNVTDVYSQFFERIDKSANGSVIEYIGREFSKTSVMLDELALDVCSADDKLARRALPMTQDIPKTGNFNPEHLSLIRSETALKDLARRKTLHNGKHKVCFSQSDLVVAPITLSQAMTAKQRDHLQNIHKHQDAKVKTFSAKLKDSLNVTPEPSTANAPNRLITEFYSGTKATPLPHSCGWMNDYPALSVTHPLMEDVASGLSQWKNIGENEFNQIMQSITPLLPGMGDFINAAGGVSDLRGTVNTGPKNEACRIKGGQFNETSMTCSPRDNTSGVLTEPEYNYCPPGAPMTDEKYRVEAARVQLNVNASLRLAIVSAMQSLERYRTASDEIMLLPLASLHGTTKLELNKSSAAKQVFSELSVINLDELIGSRILVVEKVDSETVPICSLKNSGEPVEAEQSKVENVTSVFANFSESSLDFMKNGIKNADYKVNYTNFATRYLNTRCIGAATQLLYNGSEQMPGLLQQISFADVSMVAAGTVPAGGRVSPSTQEMLETSRSVSLPFASFILVEEFARDKFPQQIGAKLMKSGHLQIGLCVASERYDAPIFNPDNSSDYLAEVVSYKESVKNLFCEAMPGHREYVEKIEKIRAKYERTTDSLKPIFDELPYPTSGFIYEKMTTKAVADALPRMFGHLNFIMAIPNWIPASERAKYGYSFEYATGFENASSRYFLSAGDSGTTISVFGLFPMFMLSTVQDVPVSGGISVVPSTSGQDVQPGSGSNCR